ncbi:hypothetical protein F2Q68_00010990 [Brassica cretica]|uniref:Uncharacterized protein n=1 Tax=Brassica cretica TaxID=69181 RepID=A0A8S9L0K8_BRACR|nr:hypothetical protein F2Q68_00010990 [Brassica cretica]
MLPFQGSQAFRDGFMGGISQDFLGDDFKSQGSHVPYNMGDYSTQGGYAVDYATQGAHGAFPGNFMNQNSQGGYSRFSGSNDFMSQEYMPHGAQGLFTQAGFIDSSQDDGQQNPFGVNNPNLQSQCPMGIVQSVLGIGHINTDFLRLLVQKGQSPFGLVLDTKGIVQHWQIVVNVRLSEIAGGDFDLLSGRAENNGREAVVDDARDRSVDPEFADVVWCRSIPFRLGSDGSIEQLLDLPQENFRLSVVSGLDWGDVLLTQSSVGTVLLLLKGCKACGEDSRLWFLIPCLITSYCSPRGIALTQLMTGVIRIFVALAVMAAEIDVSMSNRIFEELTQIQPKPNGLYTVQMRSGLQILTGHSSRTKKDWHRFYFYVKADEFAFEETSGDDFQFLWSHCIGR